LALRQQQLSTRREITSPGIDGYGGVTRRTAPEGRTGLQQRTGRTSFGRGIAHKGPATGSQ